MPCEYCGRTGDLHRRGCPNEEIPESPTQPCAFCGDDVELDCEHYEDEYGNVFHDEDCLIDHLIRIGYIKQNNGY